MLQFTKNLLYRWNPKSAAYFEVVMVENKMIEVKGIKHVVFEHKFIHAN